MAKLSLYVHPQGQLILHRAGFSWLAAIHPFFWALHRRMWVTAIAGSFLLWLLYSWLGKAVALLPIDRRLAGLLAIGRILLYALIWGMFINRWHRKYLELRGFRLMATEACQTIAQTASGAK
jgi:hypothetical protein